MSGVLKVLAICVEDPEMLLGGMGRHIRELYRHMAQRDDVEIDLLTACPAKLDEHDEHKPFVEYHGYRKWTWDVIASQKGRFPSIRSVFQTDVMWLSRLLEMVNSGYKWDVIHAHEWSSLQVAQMASRVLELPIVGTMHLCMRSLWDLDKPMKLPKRTKVLLKEYQESLVKKEAKPLTRNQKKKIRESIIVQEAAGLECDAWTANQEGKLNIETHELILCSHAYCEMSEKYYKINSMWQKSPFMIPNGIDCGDWHPGAGDARRARETHDKIGWRPIALFVGRIATMKGIEYILQAVSDEDTGYQVVIAGEVNADVGGEDWYVTQWIRALEKKYPKRLAWLGFQRDQELQDLYAAAQCVIMPSTTEPFGIVAFEAMAMGTPLIATTMNGLGEIVSDGKTDYAMIIPPRDSKAIASALRWFLDNETGQQIYSGLGLKRVKDPRFDWNNIAAQTVEVYRQTSEAWNARNTRAT